MAFLNPLFLLGGLAVSIPILLHLIKRKSNRKIEFPTLMYLRKIDKKKIRYQKLRHLLLLLLRILAFLFIVFTFMRPYLNNIEPLSAAVLGRSAASHIIALDNSMSMSYEDRWERAKTAARDIVRQSPDMDRFAVVEFSDRSGILTQLTNDKSDVLKGIENAAEPGERATRYAQALRVAENIARQSETDTRIIHLISDFQKSGWTVEDSQFQLSAGIELQYVDLGSDEFGNLLIRNVRSDVSEHSGTSTLDISASIVELGDLDRNDVRVKLIMNDRTVSEKTVHVEKKSAAEIEFQVPDLDTGEYPVVLEVDDPQLERDNRFYMTVDVRGKTPVTVVEKTESSSPGRRPASFFLTRALDIDRLSPYEVHVASPQDLNIPGRLLIWNNLPPGSRAIQKRVEDLIRNGGGMIVVLGNSISASEFNSGFGSWLPVKMEEFPSPGKKLTGNGADRFVLMTDIKTDHPVFQPFGKPHSGTFSNARFYSYARISAGPGAEILARFDNGDPALVSVGVDNGQVLIFTSSADDSGNDLPLKPVYAPFWQQMLRYLESLGEDRNWLEIGDIIDPVKIMSEHTLRLEGKVVDPDEAFAILDPSNRRLEPSPDSAVIITGETGFFEIRSSGINTVVAVNSVPAESDLTHHNAEEMTAAWTSSRPDLFREDQEFGAEEKDRRRPVWIFLFLASLLFLMSELILSNSGLRRERSTGPETGDINS